MHRAGTVVVVVGRGGDHICSRAVDHRLLLNSNHVLLSGRWRLRCRGSTATAERGGLHDRHCLLNGHGTRVLRLDWRRSGQPVAVTGGQLVRLEEGVAVAAAVFLGVHVHDAEVLALLHDLDLGRLPLNDGVALGVLLRRVRSLVHDTSLLRTIGQPLLDDDVARARRQVAQALDYDAAWRGGALTLHLDHLVHSGKNKTLKIQLSDKNRKFRPLYCLL